MKRIGPAAQAAELVQLGVGVHVALLSLVTANAAHSADPSWGPARGPYSGRRDAAARVYRDRAVVVKILADRLETRRNC